MECMDWDPCFLAKLFDEDFNNDVSLLDISFDENLPVEAVEKIERELHQPEVEDITKFG